MDGNAQTEVIKGATAAGTAMFGIFIDAGYTINEISIFSASYIAVSIVLLFIIRKKLEPIYL